MFTFSKLADYLHFQSQLLTWSDLHFDSWQISIFNSLLLIIINMINSCHHSKFQNFPTLNLVLTLERAIFISSCVHRPWRVGRAWACYHTFWQPKKQEKIQDSIAFINKTKTFYIFFFFDKKKLSNMYRLLWLNCGSK